MQGWVKCLILASSHDSCGYCYSTWSYRDFSLMSSLAPHRRGSRVTSGSLRTFRLKTQCKWCRFGSNLNVEANEPFGWTHGSSLEALHVFFPVVYLTFEDVVPQLLQLYWIWLWRCLPQRLQKFLLKHFTHPSINIVREFKFFCELSL